MSDTSPTQQRAFKSNRPTVVIDGIAVDVLHVKTFPISVSGRDALLEFGMSRRCSVSAPTTCVARHATFFP